jgi:hypothetical protein
MGMVTESRLRRIERKAMRLWLERSMAETDRLLELASLDAKQVFIVHLARSICDDRPNPQNLGVLQKEDEWLAQREAAEPGFTVRIEGELSRLGIL